MGTYFKTNINCLSYRELWRIASTWPGFLCACVRKLFALPYPPVRHAVLQNDVIEVVHPDEVPVDAFVRMEPLVKECEGLGARPAFYFTVPAVGVAGYAAALFVRERNALIVITWSKSGKAEECYCVFTSRLADGTFLSTTTARQRFNMPPEFTVIRIRGASATELAERHQQALAESPVAALPVHTEEHAKKALLDARRRNYEWNAARGVWVPLTADELARLGLPTAVDLSP